MRSPGESGLRFPAEWEPHAATWLVWPSNPETWPGCLEEAEREFAALVGALLESETVRVLVQNEAHAQYVRKRLGPIGAHEHLRLHPVPTFDAWLRDTGPTFVVGPQRALVALDWTFNAWGGKYPRWIPDDAVGGAIGRIAGARVLRPGLVVEGGALEVDGQGTLLVTEGTLIDPNRNPGLIRPELERRLSGLLGVHRVVWLPGEIAGDDTDGHVDNLARFVAPGRVVCASEANPRDPNHEPLRACRARLEEARDAAGRPLEVVDIPMPPPIEAQGERLPASHLNFYVSNGAVLLPTFDTPSDAIALERLEGLFTDRRVVPIPCRNLVQGLGTVHCLTQQQPSGRPVAHRAPERALD